MRDGFIKVAAGSVRTTVADTIANCEEIKKRIDDADSKGVHLLCLPVQSNMPSMRIHLSKNSYTRIIV